MKSVQGIFLAPILASIICTLTMCIISPHVGLSQIISAFIIYSAVGSIFGVVSAVMFGWPLYLLFNKFKICRWWQFGLGGVICTIPIWVAWFYPFNTGHWQTYVFSNSIYFFSVGGLAGLLFWYFVVQCQPTNKALNSPTAGTAKSAAR